LQVKLEPFSVAEFPLQVTDAMPERASVVVPLTVTDEVVTGVPLPGEVMLRFGAVLSSLTVTNVVAENPALFTAVPRTV
jgi:hypothetical protein